jgi:para-aminobenzoate synthetase component 1
VVLPDSTFYIQDTGLAEFKRTLLRWSRQFDPVLYLDSNAHAENRNAFECLLAVGHTAHLQGEIGSAFGALRDFIRTPSWAFGFMTYDLKNEIENLESRHNDGVGMPALYFFRPEAVIIVRNGQVEIESGVQEPIEIFRAIVHPPTPKGEGHASPTPHAPVRTLPATDKLSNSIQQRFSKAEYCQTVERIREHIAAGDVYEINLCQEFYAEDVTLEPYAVFEKLNDIASTPFAAFLRLGERFLMCASPERFLAKRGQQLISQPMKGTIKRSADEEEDRKLREKLHSDPKERAENVMITDLVRNDLARSSKPGSVKVKELFSVHSFPGIHQMITTVTSELRDGVDAITAIRNAFPMGSMTGAPKVAAMELIEKYEKSKRGLYSGSVGYFTPDGDFDFNVVIRSIMYNAKAKYLSFQTGGAITYDSDPEREWEECVLKAENMMRALHLSDL